MSSSRFLEVWLNHTDMFSINQFDMSSRSRYWWQQDPGQHPDLWDVRMLPGELNCIVPDYQVFPVGICGNPERVVILAE